LGMQKKKISGRGSVMAIRAAGAKRGADHEREIKGFH